MHDLLAAKLYWGDAEDAAPQALFCPYYVALRGPLGADWGVVVNPESTKFGQLVFEHDRCGCPAAEDGWPVHGQGHQNDRDWLLPRKGGPK